MMFWIIPLPPTSLDDLRIWALFGLAAAGLFLGVVANVRIDRFTRP